MTSHKNNCFDIGRHIAALMVIFSHHFILSGLEEPDFLGFETYGGIAVLMFFSISGFLISMSAMRSDNFLSFAGKRIRRIFPALIVCAIVVSLFFGFLFNPNQNVIFHIISAIKTISLNGFLQRTSSPDFQASNLINGSLWTLPLEVTCYLIVGAVIVFGKKVQHFVLVMILMLLLTVYTTHYNVTFQALSVPLSLFFPRALAFFIGCVMAVNFEKWNNLRTKFFMICFMSIFTFSSKGDHASYITSSYILFSILTIIICTSFKEKLISGRFDYSYGIYIYAFPVQQLVINKLHLEFYESMLLSYAITITLAMFSWHLIEARVLRQKRYKTC